MEKKFKIDSVFTTKVSSKGVFDKKYILYTKMTRQLEFGLRCAEFQTTLVSSDLGEEASQTFAYIKLSGRSFSLNKQ